MALSQHELICNFCAYWHERETVLFCASASFSLHYIRRLGVLFAAGYSQQSELFCFAPRIISLLFNSARQMQFEWKKHAHAYPRTFRILPHAEYASSVLYWNAAAAATVVVVAAAFLFSQIEFDCCWLKACASCLMCLQRRKSGSEIAGRHKTHTAQYSQPAARGERVCVWKYTGIESAFAPAKCQFFLRARSNAAERILSAESLWKMRFRFQATWRVNLYLYKNNITVSSGIKKWFSVCICTLPVLNHQCAERVWEYIFVWENWRRVYRCKSPGKIGSAHTKKALKLAGSARCPASFHLLLMCGGAGTCWRCESAVVKRLVISMQMLAQTGWH